MTAKDIIKALRKRHGINGRAWAFFEELRAGTGYKNVRKGHNPEQRFDAWAINLYPSKNHLTVAYEIKVSRSDFLHEIRRPEKRKQAMEHSNEFYFVTPKGLVNPNEIPKGCGLIEVDDKGNTKVVVKAEYRPDAKLTWNFLASIARRAAKHETE
jgi:hypothetical protein